MLEGLLHLVEQRQRHDDHDEEQHEGAKMSTAAASAVRRRPDEVDRDVVAPVAGRRDPPEDQDPQHVLAEVVGVRDRGGEKVAQQDRDEMLAATRPTKIAAISSIPSMNRSMPEFRRAAAAEAIGLAVTGALGRSPACSHRTSSGRPVRIRSPP